MTRPVRARISIPALQHNLQRVREAAPNTKVMAVIKANGYGHGLVPVARALATADGFGVARLEEALTLRDAGIEAPITLLEGCIDRAELAEADARKLTVTVHNEAQLAQIETARPTNPLALWVKLDTGMHRLGFAPGAITDVLRRLDAAPGLRHPLGYLSHLARADEPDHPATDAQRHAFEAGLGDRTGPRSLANSAAILGWPATHYDWVRPGIMLYGVSPFPAATASDHDLRPVMNLETRLIAVQQRRAGDAVGYGGSWVCPEDMPVGVAAIGYGDGYPRHAPAGTPLLVNGRRAALIGRVSMDMITIDLRGHEQAQEGACVRLWGEDMPVEEVARGAGTIGYELLTGVTARVQMEYVATDAA